MNNSKMGIIRIHHAQITVPQGAEGEARQFYCRFLRLPEVEKSNSLRGRGGIWLEVGGQQVYVGTESGVDRSATKAHLAYEVDDIAVWRQRLLEHGIEILEGIPIPGFERIEFRDPFGNRVEFIQRLGSMSFRTVCQPHDGMLASTNRSMSTRLPANPSIATWHRRDSTG